MNNINTIIDILLHRKFYKLRIDHDIIIDIEFEQN